MSEIKLFKKYPHIKDNDVVGIFLEGYFKGLENGRKRMIPIKWIEEWLNKFVKEINGVKFYTGDGYDSVRDMLDDWEKENGTL